jgi:hypothetical protein
MPKVRLKEEYKQWRSVISESGASFDRHLVITVGLQPKALLFDFRKTDEFEVSEKAAKLFTQESMETNGNGISCFCPIRRQYGTHYPVELVPDSKAKSKE